MTDQARTRVAERLAALRETDERLAQTLEATTGAASNIPETAIDRNPLETLGRVIAALRQPLPAELLPLATLDVARAGRADQDQLKTVLPAAGSAQAAYALVGEASGAAAALFTTGRLMFEGAACDLAVDRMKAYTQVTKALNALLPQLVGWELREEGLACRCICPACGLGACGCIWASLHNIDVASGGPGLATPDDRGIPLRSPPRPGSQLAAAGTEQWDRVVAVDDEPVRTTAELLTALRQHPIGGEVRLRIDRDGESREIVVRHASDLP